MTEPVGRFPALYFLGGMPYANSMEIKTRIRRSHLGIHYDIYADGIYRGTVTKAVDIEPLIASLK